MSISYISSFVRQTSVYIGAMTKTGRPWRRENGVTGDERTWFTAPKIVSLNQEYYSVLTTAFLQRPGSVSQEERRRSISQDDFL